MAFSEIVLPNMGFGMEEGRILAWLKQPGDAVRKGEPVAEIESDKANVELEALADGVLDMVLVPADQMVAVGTVLGRIRTGEAAPAAEPPSMSEIDNVAYQGQPASAAVSDDADRGQRISPVAQRLAREHGIDLNSVQSRSADGRITREDIQAVIDGAKPAAHSNGKVLTAPAVRKLARDNHIDLTTIKGTGKEGRIRREDVEAHLSEPPFVIAAPPAALASAPAAASLPTERTVTPAAPSQEGRREIPISNMRQTIARRLSQSAQESPHFYTTGELDFTDAAATLPKGIGLNTLILYLTTQTLLALPELNATFENGHLFQYDHVHLALAVALPNGLMTPVLRNADDFSLSGLAGHVRDLIERTRANKLKPDELSGGTFTVSNLGVVKQVDRFTAIINPPQVGILAVGTAKPRPMVVNGGLHIRTTAHLTLSADHRIIDGMLAARFLEAFDQQLQAFAG
ncbi:MAG: 2-oxo acid dehydrogenase subunit E2 [Chloroflexi bacterium]|nr:2-oxo acid dehydrogenase subunit E2 [Chloroflexota bacterium]MCC6891699.1 2-oxo acid dehydrogenase subunit E2 [Anaerolineae bacterium]